MIFRAHQLLNGDWNLEIDALGKKFDIIETVDPTSSIQWNFGHLINNQSY